MQRIHFSEKRAACVRRRSIGTHFYRLKRGDGVWRAATRRIIGQYFVVLHAETLLLKGSTPSVLE